MFRLSQVIIHLFDALVIAYFIAFPVVCVIYHPKVRCRLRMCKSSVVDTPRNANNTNNSPVIHQNASAHLVAYRRSNGILDPRNLQVTIDNIETTIWATLKLLIFHNLPIQHFFCTDFYSINCLGHLDLLMCNIHYC